MTRRERLEARADRRREWAEKAAARAERRFGAAAAIADNIPLGQPILVGHHSERHARRDAERIHRNMSKGCEENRLAKHHAAKADGMDRALERSVFADDPDAAKRLQARIASKERLADLYAKVNRAWRKHGKDRDALVADLAETEGIEGVDVAERLADTAIRTMSLAPWLGKPLDTTSLRAAIRRDLDRIKQIRRRVEAERLLFGGQDGSEVQS